MINRNIAVIGAGFAGLGVSWHLKQQNPGSHITIFDPLGIGGGTSGIAAGLLHPYTGEHAKLNKFGHEGMQATQLLLNIASQALGEQVFQASGILRLALNESQVSDFTTRIKQNDPLEWWSNDKCQASIPGIDCEGLWIPSGITVYTKRYLEGLWRACSERGVQFKQKAIHNLSELDAFDIVVVAAGISTLQFQELKHLPLKPIRGQLLELTWPKSQLPLPFALNSKAYIVMNPGNNTCIAGTTFEKERFDMTPDQDYAIQQILPEVHKMLPSLKESKVVACHAGIRVKTPDRLPIVEKINDMLWVITGMGSKGLLYHALFAEKLAKEIAQEKCTEQRLGQLPARL